MLTSVYYVVKRRGFLVRALLVRNHPRGAGAVAGVFGASQSFEKRSGGGGWEAAEKDSPVNHRCYVSKIECFAIKHAGAQ